MNSNYHTHTWRCGHAIGEDRDYVEAAIKAGFKSLGFSDHSPMPWGSSYDRASRMTMKMLDDYCISIGKLRDEYCDQIDIHIGLEIEYYPLFFDDVIRSSSNIEYYILGQHCLGNQIDAPTAIRKPTTDETVLSRYVTQLIAGVTKHKFLFIAHPDLINFVGDSGKYATEMKRLCMVTNSLSVPLEINLSGIAKKRHYPNDAFWRIAGETGNRCVIGYDAHNPNDFFSFREAEEIAVLLAQKCGVKICDPLHQTVD